MQEQSLQVLSVEIRRQRLFIMLMVFCFLNGYAILDFVIILTTQTPFFKMTEPHLSKNMQLRSLEIKEEIMQSHQSQQADKIAEETKTTRWKEDEHIRYILFLEDNREMTKSKLIRRSNSFFKEMSVFVGTKTGIQCRSHHQKYEAKHKYPHKIINEEKMKFSLSLYESLKEKVGLKQITCSQPSLISLKSQAKQVHKVLCKESRDMACQTDLQGVSDIYMMLAPLSVPFPLQPTAHLTNYYVYANQWEVPQISLNIPPYRFM